MLPISALLSQALVAFTIEFDNEFEQRMLKLGFRGIGLSLMVWSNLLRFVRPDGMQVGDLVDATLIDSERTVAMLGCLERWRFLTLAPSAAGKPSSFHAHPRTGRMVRDGYGSGRRIRRDWIVRLTDKGRGALATWPTLFDSIEARWRSRFGGSDIAAMRAALAPIVGSFVLDLPDALPQDGPAGFGSFPPTRARADHEMTLPALLSKALLGFALAFQREAAVPLALAANVLRVVTEQGVLVSDLAALTGLSPEVCALGWKLKPFVTTAGAVNGRKLAHLTAAGARVHDAYPRLARHIERQWEAAVGEQVIDDLRTALCALFRPGPGGRALIVGGLIPSPAVRRSGEHSTTAGVLAVVPAERKRTRDMAVQTAAFIDDPSRSLPHFPLWDMNRGFGP